MDFFDVIQLIQLSCLALVMIVCCIMLIHSIITLIGTNKLKEQKPQKVYCHKCKQEIKPKIKFKLKYDYDTSMSNESELDNYIDFEEVEDELILFEKSEESRDE